MCGDTSLQPALGPLATRSHPCPFLLRKEALQVFPPPAPSSDERQGRGRRGATAGPDTGAGASPPAKEEDGLHRA